MTLCFWRRGARSGPMASKVFIWGLGARGPPCGVVSGFDFLST